LTLLQVPHRLKIKQDHDWEATKKDASGQFALISMKNQAKI
jgi:hypothetical protein